MNRVDCENSEWDRWPTYNKASRQFNHIDPEAYNIGEKGSLTHHARSGEHMGTLEALKLFLI